MSAKKSWFTLLFLPWLLAAQAEPDPAESELVAERNALIDKLARGEETEANLARFVALKKRFDALLEQRKLRSMASIEGQKLSREKWTAYLHSLDFRVGQECPMAVDPANRPTGDGHHVRKGEHGKIIAKKTTQIPAKTGFDEDQIIEVYQVKAQTGTYSFGNREMHTHDGKPFTGKIGDWVFLCYSSAAQHGSGSYLPPEFRERVISSGFVSRIKGPPKIVEKAKWNPLHLVGLSTLQRAAQTGRWPIDENVPVLSLLIVEKELGQGRYEIRLDSPHNLGRPSQHTFILVVPSNLAGSERLGPGEVIWAIMTTPVVDKKLRKIILTAVDLEPSYIEAIETPK